MNERVSTPVLVVGAGPVGLIVALELAHHGIACTLVDREAEATRFPKMDITNARSMELLRRLGLSDPLRRHGVAPHHRSDVLWALPDGSPPLGRWRLPSVNEQNLRICQRNDGSQPSEPSQRAQQSLIEQIGREACRSEPLIQFHEGVAFEDLHEGADGVTARVVSLLTDRRLTVDCSYLVAADGAGSKVRDAVGITTNLIGSPPRNHMIHFESGDLEEMHRHGKFWHWFAMGSVVIAQDEERVWTFHCPLFDGESDTLLDPAELVWRRSGLRPRIDRVLLRSTWQPRFALADAYRRSRVFLAGDSAHQFFPVGGYGMNTGVGDAVDIGWKLAAVIRGWAGEGLLDSYEAERRAVGASNRMASLRHLDVHIGLIERARAGIERAELADFIAARRGENEFAGHELGYRYDGSPVIWADAGDDAPRWSEWDYIPSTWPGARPPSFLMPDGQGLFDRFDRGMTLVDFNGDAEPLVASAKRRGIPVGHFPIANPKIAAAWERSYVLVRPDQHVAWRADAMPDARQWQRILDRVTGH